MSFEDLAFWANVGSLVGLLFSLGGAAASIRAYFQLRETRRRYRLLIQGPNLVEQMREYASDLVDHTSLSTADLKSVLGRSRATLQVLASLLDTADQGEIEETRTRLRRMMEQRDAFSQAQIEGLVASFYSYTELLNDELTRRRIEQP